LGLFVNFNIKITSFLENATPDEYVGLHAHSKLVSPCILNQRQSLFIPFAVIKFIFEILKGYIRLMRVFDNESL